MGEGRSTTTLDIKVNARDLSKLDQKLKEVFGGSRTRDFSRGAEASNKAISALAKAVQQLTTELGKSRAASDMTFGKMESDARDARKEVQALRQELAQLKTTGGPSGGSSTGWGVAQGGGGPQQGGGWKGAPQVAVPDASAIATAMSSIPFIGLAAGGATMASYQMYGSALGYQTARRDTFAALGPQGSAMLRLRMTQKAQAERSVVRSGSGDGALDAGLAGVSEATGLPEWAIGGMHQVYSGFDRYVYDTGTGKAIERAVTQKAKDAGYDVERIAAKKAEYSANMSTADLEDVGVRYGLKPGDALREAAGLSSAMGRRASADTYDFARSAQTYFGVDQGTSGGLMKSFRLASSMGAQDQQADAVARLIGSAVARGLENSEIAGYLQQMSGFLQKQADMGQTDQLVEGMAIVAERMTRSGFSGAFATSYATRLGEAGSQMGYGAGAADPVKFAMLQKLGYGREGDYSAEAYANAMLALQDPDQAAVAGLGAMSSLSSSMRDSGMGAGVRALTMSRYSGLIGAQVGPDAARRFAEGIAGAGYEDTPTSAADIRRLHQEAGGSTVGILAGEAGMESDRINAGFKAATQVQNMNGVMIDLANTAQNIAGPALDLLTTKLKSMSEAAREWDPHASGSGLGSAGGR